MTPEEKQLTEFFTPQQFTQLKETADFLCGPFTNSLAHAAMRRVFYNALLASFAAGRLRGMLELRDVISEKLPPQVGRAIFGASLGDSLEDALAKSLGIPKTKGGPKIQ